jgi:FkbM family methyltransferase
VTGLTDEDRRRIDLTTAVRDTDRLPRVADAGAVVVRDGRRVQIMHNGVLIDEGCYHGEFMTEIIRRLQGHHEPQEELVFHAIIDRLAQEGTGGTAVELGSFWAYYSLWAKAALPDATCVCVEPDPRNLEVGRRNFELNGLDARFVHAAVGAPHGSTLQIRTESDNRVRPVPLVSLEGLMRDHELERIDLLLSDIQGAEVGLLEHAAAVLRSGQVRFLVVSTHHHSISGDTLTHQRCLDLLRTTGAHVIAEHSVSESCSGDGLVAVSFDPRDADLQVHPTIVRSRDTLYGEPEYEIARAQRFSPEPLARRAASALRLAVDRRRR